MFSAGRADGRLGDRDVSGRVEERQEDGFRDIGAERRASIRGGVVQQPEVRLRGDDVPGREQGGGQVQEQRVDHQPEEEASVPNQIGQVPREDRGGRERGPACEQDRPPEGGYRDIENGDRPGEGGAGRHGGGPGEGGFGIGPADGETVRARLQAAGVGEVEEQGDTQVRATPPGHGAREEHSSQGERGSAGIAQEPDLLVPGRGCDDHGQQRDAVDQEGEHQASESIAAEPVVADRARESGDPGPAGQPAAPRPVEPDHPARPKLGLSGSVSHGSEPCSTPGLSQQYTESVSADDEPVRPPIRAESVFRYSR